MRLSLSFGLLVALTASQALAGDGVLEINQSCALNTGCFSGDTAGFPVTINGTAGRSYRLTGDLSVANANTNGVTVTADGISLDLNGFVVAGPVACSGERLTLSCGSGIGVGVLGSNEFVVMGGFVRGFGGDGIRTGFFSQVNNVIASGNGGSGIAIARSSRVSDSTARRNAGAAGISTAQVAILRSNVTSDNRNDGIFVGTGSSTVGNIAEQNGGAGIQATSGVVSDNSCVLNSGDGILAIGGSTITNNLAVGNSGDGIDTDTNFASTIRGNTVAVNTEHGLEVGNNSSYSGNTIDANTAGSVTGFTTGDTGGNLCNGGACP